MPNINLDNAYILDETGAQVDKVTGLFTKDEDTTSGEKAFAQLNIGTAGSNRNLLDNPWFTVNQRGISGTISGNYGYSFDRWQKRGNGTLTVNSDGSLTLDGTSTYSQMREPLEPSLCAFLVGHTVTLSVLFSDNTVFSATYNVAGATQYYTYMADGTSYISLDLREEQRTAFVLINGNSKTVKAMKLELGSVSTLANDPPPDFGEELAKCQRYYYRITGVTFLDLGAALAESATTWLLRFPLPVPMRVAPTTAVSGNFVLWNGSVGNACSGISTHTVVTPPTNPAYVAIKGTSTGMTTGNRYNIQARNQASAYIEFSADL